MDSFPHGKCVRGLSWKLVAEFHRRHPAAWTIIETHPGGGQYDCLTLVTKGEAVAYLNREGGFTVFGPQEGRIEWADLWTRCLVEGGMARVLDRMTDLCGLTVPKPVPATGRETLAYRVMAGVMANLILEPAAWEWRNGQEDTAGYGDQPGRDTWFETFSGAREATRNSQDGDVFGKPKYRFWFLLKDGHPNLCLNNSARCWTRDGKCLNLFGLYRKTGQLHGVEGKLLGAISG